MLIHVAVPESNDGGLESLREAIEPAPTGLPYWADHDHIDRRTVALWSIGVPIDIAARIVSHLCAELGLPDVRLAIDEPSPEIVAEALADPELMEIVLDLSDDGRYQAPADGLTAQIVFDGPVIDHGANVPLELIAHELSHHVVWHRHGDVGHGDVGFDEPFADALREVYDRIGELVDLTDYAAPAPTPDQGRAMWEQRQAFLAGKWRELAPNGHAGEPDGPGSEGSA